MRSNEVVTQRVERTHLFSVVEVRDHRLVFGLCFRDGLIDLLELICNLGQLLLQTDAFVLVGVSTSCRVLLHLNERRTYAGGAIRDQAVWCLGAAVQFLREVDVFKAFWACGQKTELGGRCMVRFCEFLDIVEGAGQADFELKRLLHGFAKFSRCLSIGFIKLMSICGKLLDFMIGQTLCFHLLSQLLSLSFPVGMVGLCAASVLLGSYRMECSQRTELGQASVELFNLPLQPGALVM